VVNFAEEFFEGFFTLVWSFVGRSFAEGLASSHLAHNNGSISSSNNGSISTVSIGNGSGKQQQFNDTGSTDSSSFDEEVKKRRRKLFSFGKKSTKTKVKNS
jgi:hypothetical protein